MHLDDLHTFVTAADEGSFRAAADRLGVPTSTVSRRVARLEDALGITLFHRGGARPRLTAEGRGLAARSRPALLELERLHDLSEGCPRGVLRLTAPPDLASTAPFIDLVHGFRERHPALDLDLDLTNRNVDLVQEGFDIALRPHPGPLPEAPGVMARRVGTLQAALYAAPHFAIPGAPADAAALPPVLLLHRALRDAWPHPHQIRVVASDFHLLMELAVRGGGIVIAPTFSAEPWVASGRLRRLALPPPIPTVGRLSVLWPEARHLSPRIRAFLDHVETVRRDEPLWQLA